MNMKRREYIAPSNDIFDDKKNNATRFFRSQFSKIKIANRQISCTNDLAIRSPETNEPFRIVLYGKDTVHRQNMLCLLRTFYTIIVLLCKLYKLEK